jgi:hypothetical protein
VHAGVVEAIVVDRGAAVGHRQTCQALEHHVLDRGVVPSGRWQRDMPTPTGGLD